MGGLGIDDFADFTQQGGELFWSENDGSFRTQNPGNVVFNHGESMVNLWIIMVNNGESLWIIITIYLEMWFLTIKHVPFSGKKKQMSDSTYTKDSKHTHTYIYIYAYIYICNILMVYSIWVCLKIVYP